MLVRIGMVEAEALRPTDCDCGSLIGAMEEVRNANQVLESEILAVFIPDLLGSSVNYFSASV